MKLPTTYEEWRYCIEVACRQPLSPDYVATRLDALRNTADPQTARFLELYGGAHLAATIGWFEQAARDQASTAQAN